jgi:predicted protein tyrosine phosphatase
MKEKLIIALPKVVFDKVYTSDIIALKSYACFISILDQDNNEKKHDCSLPNFLQVKMWDVEMDLEDMSGRKYEKPADVELQKIVNFIDSHKDKSYFVVHCSAGISRSGAVVRYILEHFEDSDKQWFNQNNKFIQPNLYILKRLKQLSKDKL